MHKYKGLVEQLYKDTVDGVFKDATKSILQKLSQELAMKVILILIVWKQETSTQWMQARAPADTNNRVTVITINNTINLILTSIKFSNFIKIAKNRKIKYAQTIVSLR